MPRGVLAVLVALTLPGRQLAAADELPKHAPGEGVDSDSRLMFETLPDLNRLEPGPDFIAPAPALTVERAKMELDRARAKQQRWQQLAKAGVLSQVEAESTALQVARAVVRYQAALAAQATAQVAQVQARRDQGESTADELAAAEVTQRTAAALAADAAAQLQRQQRLAAEAHLDRQRRLLALGVATKAQVRRAEEKLAALPAR